MENYYGSDAPTSFARRGGNDTNRQQFPFAVGTGGASAGNDGGRSTTMRYLDITSAFRNRQLAGQSVCDFSVPVNAPMRDEAGTALDPVVPAFPVEVNYTSGASTTTNVRLNSSSSGVDNFYRGCVLEVGGAFVDVVAYHSSTRVAEVQPPLPVAPPTGTVYSVRNRRPVYRGTVAAAAGTQALTLDAAAAGASATYSQCFVFLPGSNPPDSYRWAPIAAYDGAAKTLLLGGGGLRGGGGSPHPQVGEVVEVQAFARDNVVPLVYVAPDPNNGQRPLLDSGPSRTPMYRVQLCDFVLPNLPVANGYGGHITDYPYVYVGVRNDQGATFSNLLMSNNPAARQAVFKVPMSQYSTHVPFLFFDGGDIEQVLRISPDQNLRVTIWLPDGDVLAFRDVSPTFYFPGRGFPTANNPFAQVGLTLGVTRL
jgi:hypothetical protein